MWLNRHKHNNSLLIFVHGLFGDRWETWKGFHDVLQDHLLTNPLIRSFDIFLVSYETTLWRQPTIDVAVDAIAGVFRKWPEKYATAVLIGHSQGGIAAKLYVIDELLNGRGETMCVDRVITLATPHHGVRVLRPLYLLGSIPGLSRVERFRQLRELSPGSATMRRLKEHWTPQHIALNADFKATPGKRYIRSLAVAAAKDWIVSPQSAHGFTVDTADRVICDHRAISKARSASEAIASKILSELCEHHPPEYLDDIRHITPWRHELYMAMNAKHVFNELKRLRPAMSHDAAVARAGFLLDRFLEHAPQRPLRKLPLESALLEYVRRELGPEI